MRETLVESEEFKNSPLGKIPKDWEIVNIAAFASIKYGINDAIDQTLESGVSTITLPCVKPTGELVLHKDMLELTSRHKMSRDNFLQHGDLLFNWRNGSQEHLGKTAYFDASGEYTHVGFLLRIRTIPELCNSRYLWWRLCYMKYQGFFLKAKSQVNNTFNSGELAAVSVLMPPLLEQKSIAEILDTVDKAIARTESLIAKLKQMKAGLLQDLLTRGLDENGQLRDAITHPEQFKDSPLGRIPKDWDIETLGGIGVGGISNGFFKKPELVGSGYRLINVFDLYQDFGINLNLVERVNATKEEQHKYSVQPGDCFFTRSSLNLAGIAHCNIIRDVTEPALFECHLMRVRPNQFKVVPEFLAHWCRSKFTKQFFMGRAKQVTMTTISQPDIAPLLVPLPPKLEQESIVKMLDTHNTRIRTEEAYLDKLKLQKKGLMHDLLTGKVRVNAEAITQTEQVLV